MDVVNGPGGELPLVDFLVCIMFRALEGEIRIASSWQSAYFDNGKSLFYTLIYI